MNSHVSSLTAVDAVEAGDADASRQAERWVPHSGSALPRDETMFGASQKITSAHP